MDKIAFLGAGSTVFAKNVLGDCMLTGPLQEFEYALYDIDMQRLADREPNGVVGYQRRENALRVTPGAEIENGREVAQHGDRTQHDRTDGARRSRFEFGAGQSEYQETQQRQYEN